VIAAERFEAKSPRPAAEAPLVPEGTVAKVPAVELEQVALPAELPDTLPHEKLLALSLTAKNGPGVVAVTVK
jgi:hypothetical protein